MTRISVEQGNCVDNDCRGSLRAACLSAAECLWRVIAYSENAARSGYNITASMNGIDMKVAHELGNLCEPCVYRCSAE